MPVEFSEHRVKKKYKSKRKKFPLFRLVFLAGLIGCGFYFGWFSKLVNAIPLFNEEVAPAEITWDSRCKSVGGTPFELKDSLAQCSWIVNDSTPLFFNGFVRYVASLRKSPVAKLHWVAKACDFDNPILVQLEDSLVCSYLRVPLKDSSKVWIDARTGCAFPGLCPARPLDWSNIDISENFDFEGQDKLLAADAFYGLGEAPLHPILPGVVLDAGRDSMGLYVEIDHGNNVFSKMSGMTPYASGEGVSVKVGDTVTIESWIGRIPPRDSAACYLSIRRNGLFLRWTDFYAAAHPLDSVGISNFLERTGIRL